MPAKFQTVRRRARFVYYGYNADAMQRISDATAQSVITRIQRAETVHDAPAAALKSAVNPARSYARQKQRRGAKPIRDWTFTGHTLKSLKTMIVSANKAVIGFLNNAWGGRKLTAPQIAWLLNRKERQFGLSPRDKQTMMGAVHTETPSAVKAVKS